MSKDYLTSMNIQFARGTIRAFLDMAIKAATELGIDDFILVPTDKDLNSSTIEFIGNFRYRKTKDGHVIIHSVAMQQLAVSHGMAATLPWIHNVCNPRIQPMHNFVDGRIWGRVQRSLLARAGDVESNPGPTRPHIHVCYKCKLPYLHTHGGVIGPHLQYDYQCPNVACEVHFFAGEHVAGFQSYW